MLNKKGYFGEFGGQFVPETLISALEKLERKYSELKKNKNFRRELDYYLKEYVGRPTPLYFAQSLSKKIGAKIYLKREDLCHTGAHKINNALGQILLARWMGKQRIIAETGAGQHGVAVATAAAMFDLPCEVYMGKEDIKRQSLNVFRMKLLGAKIIPVDSGSKTLKDACNEAIRDWVTNVRTTYYLIGSVVGPYPYPLIVRDFQSIIGREAKKQILRLEKRLPDYLIACVGGGSNSIGLFHPFFAQKKVKFIGVEAGGTGIKTGKHAATLIQGNLGILHGSKTYLLQDKDGQVKVAHSLAPGLDYPAVGPEHSYYKKIDRCRYFSVTDKEALKALKMLSQTEGIIPALESAHAFAYLEKMKFKKNEVVIVCLSGRGDKDMEIVKEEMTKSE